MLKCCKAINKQTIITLIFIFIAITFNSTKAHNLTDKCMVDLEVVEILHE